VKEAAQGVAVVGPYGEEGSLNVPSINRVDGEGTKAREASQGAKGPSRILVLNFYHSVPLTVKYKSKNY
jgi:hypothetical protein